MTQDIRAAAMNIVADSAHKMVVMHIAPDGVNGEIVAPMLVPNAIEMAMLILTRAIMADRVTAVSILAELRSVKTLLPPLAEAATQGMAALKAEVGKPDMMAGLDEIMAGF